jgi:hypothetical protein
MNAERGEDHSVTSSRTSRSRPRRAPHSACSIMLKRRENVSRVRRKGWR